MVSGDPTGAVASRLSEDSCVNEAHYAAREYMVLCTVLGTRVTKQTHCVQLITHHLKKAHIKVFRFITVLEKLKQKWHFCFF